jgi:hypothetical protein
MLNADMVNFVIGMVGASASFIGLLFVAISLGIGNSLGTQSKDIHMRLLAESSYVALLNIFFVSACALVPGDNLGYVISILSVIGLVTLFRLFRNSSLRQSFGSLALSILVYICELLFGIYILLQKSSYIIDNYAFMTLMLFLLGISLARAWELTGLRNNNI